MKKASIFLMTILSFNLYANHDPRTQALGGVLSASDSQYGFEYYVTCAKWEGQKCTRITAHDLKGSRPEHTTLDINLDNLEEAEKKVYKFRKNSFNQNPDYLSHTNNTPSESIFLPVTLAMDIVKAPIRLVKDLSSRPSNRKQVKGILSKEIELLNFVLDKNNAGLIREPMTLEMDFLRFHIVDLAKFSLEKK